MEKFFSLRLAFVATLLCFVATADVVNQGILDNIAANLVIRYDVLDNMQNSWRNYRVRLTLKNVGSVPIQRGAWAIFLCHIRIIEPDHTKHNDAGYNIPGSGLRVYHINGCQHKLEPTHDFLDLAAGQARQLEFDAENWAVARTDVMPNWYVAARGLQARTIISTSGEDLSFVGAFDSPNKWKRFGPDRFNPYTPQQRYKINDVTDLNRPGQLVVPSPSEISGYDEARFVDLGTGDWTIHAAGEVANEAWFLAHKLGLKTINAKSSFRQIHINIGDVRIKGMKSTSSEAYSLKINPQGQSVSIVGQSVEGAFYGIQSLLSIADPDKKAPQVTINDAPRYEYRGMEVDVGRNFMPKQEITKLIDVMAMYKLNKLHLHLTDDEGWRLEIPGLSELTEMASRRCHDPQEESCVDSQLGSGAGTGNSGTGYYTVDEYKDILRFARDRKVEVIPEFDMPGHGHAAIKAMQLRRKRLAGQGKVWEAQRFLLSDSQDASQYLSVQFFKDNAINPCLESTYEFVEHIVNQVRQMHLEIQPLKVFHFGGDEVAHGAWTKSPACKNLARRLGLNFTSPTIVKDLKEYFVRRVADITSRYCLDLGAWEDGVLGVGDTPYDRSYLKNKNVLAYAWDNVWEWGQGNRAYKLANAGYKVKAAPRNRT